MRPLHALLFAALCSCRGTFDVTAGTAAVELSAAHWATKHGFTGPVDCAEASSAEEPTDCIARSEPGREWPTRLRCTARRCIEAIR